MTASQPKNLAASVRQRLLNHAVKTEQDFQVVLAQYGFERLLYRLSQSAYDGQFTLKGALMFLVWTGEQYRPTRDMDLMSKQKRTAAELRNAFHDVCSVQVDDDGLVLLADTVEVESIPIATNATQRMLSYSIPGQFLQQAVEVGIPLWIPRENLGQWQTHRAAAIDDREMAVT